ncbi:MAG TPA: hypothetical protein VKA84_25380 [Gemmatimonadaceae bacterium]|nr:hypothetical protein [Gemmatimonadaceae bacterium]
MRIALVGDYDPAVTAHQAIPRALELAAAAAGGARAEPEWVHTSGLAEPGAAEARLAAFDAVWCVPASPYASMDGALAAIRFARERGRPFLGTCGGFQHALIEYARNALGLADADHAETAPDAAFPLIAPLACSMVEVTGTVRLLPGSRAAALYGAPEAREGYHCSFGLNPRFRALLERSPDLAVSGVDEAGDVRIVELASHPFFVATLFQPERWALGGRAHPVVNGFVAAARDS